jgi:hypothetical protein
MAIFKRSSQEARKSSAKKSTKTVSFTDETNINQIEPYEDIREIWYSDEDESAFRERDTKMAHLLLAMDPNELEFKLMEDSPRGLEYSMPNKTKITNQRRKNSRVAVIATQKLFQKQKKDGSDSIARAYTVCCDAAKSDAFQLASRDAQFVKDHVRVEPTNRRDPLEKERSVRPSLLGRNHARRSLHQ